MSGSVDTTRTTSSGIVYQRGGPAGDLPVVLVHAGIADRRMWDPIWPGLTTYRDALRLDLRGFGDSIARPESRLDPVTDLHTTVTEAGVSRCHLVGASFGAGVAIEFALRHPGLVDSLLLVAPGGSLITTETEDLAEFVAAEDAALDHDDLDGAAGVNVRYWVDGPRRGPGVVDDSVRAAVHQMQRRAFEITADWDDVEEYEELTPAAQRLADITVPTQVLTGGHDLSAIADAAQQVTSGISGAQQIDWSDVAHLPSMEQPQRFLGMLDEWLARAEAVPR